MSDNPKAVELSFDKYKLPPIGHAISGAIGSTIANLFIYPLDISTTRLQLNSAAKGSDHGIWKTITTIYKTEGGVAGLYAGLGADTLATVLSSFIYFYCYTALRNIQEKFNSSMGKRAQLNMAQELFLGAEAALISRLFTTPVSNVTTRLQTAGKGNQNSFMDTVREIYEERGIRGFWTGYRASMVLVSNPSITYFALEKIKDAYLALRKKTTLTSLEVFLISAIAKTIATMVTYPFIFLRTCMIAKRPSTENKEDEKQAEGEAKEGMISILKQVIQKEGPTGVYRGMRAQVTKGFFNQGIMYMIKDRVATYLTLVFYTSLKLRMRKNALVASHP